MSFKVLTSIWGKRLGLDKEGNLITEKGFASGTKGTQIILPSPTKVALFDDFLGDVVADQWNYVEGTDTTTADGAIVALESGVFRLTSGDSAGTTAADGAELNSELNWKANQGGLKLTARVKLAAITSVSAFIGFTDTKSLEDPIFSAASGNTLTTDASDAVGFMFDTNMTDDNWWAVGVANNVDATAQNLAVAPVAATYAEFSVEVNSSGEAFFFYNGNPIGTKMTGAVTATVALTPVFFIRPLSAVAGRTMDIDYINVSANRV